MKMTRKLTLNGRTSDRSNAIYVFGVQIVHCDFDCCLHGFFRDVLGSASRIVRSDYSENFVHSPNLSFLKPESTFETTLCETDDALRPYYRDSSVTIYHGDCREILPLLSRVDLVLMDPPYGMNLGVKANNQRFDRLKYTSYDDSPEATVILVNEVLHLCFAQADLTVMTPGVRNMFAYPKPTHVGSFYYPSASGCNSWGFSCWQPIYFYGKDPFGGKGSKPDSFQSTEHSEPNGHPCPKPIGQWKWLLNRSSKPQDIVLDPFLGSGTTARAAKDRGQRVIGIEIEEKYCEIAAKRMEQEVLSLNDISIPQDYASTTAELFSKNES